MPIYQCEKCEFGDCRTGNIRCTNDHVNWEYFENVCTGQFCVYQKRIDDTDQGEPIFPYNNDKFGLF